MGLPKVLIDFFSDLKKEKEAKPERVVALILKDTNKTGSFEYKPGDTIDKKWSSNNKDYIKLALKGNPRKVMVEAIDETSDYADALPKFKHKKFDYMAVPGIGSPDVDAVKKWVKERRDQDRKRYKAVLPNADANHESIINFTTDNIQVGDTTYSASEFTARIAGALAGLPFDKSATYLVLDDVDSIDEIDDPDKAVDNGEFILINDGENIKVGRGVNSLTDVQSSDDKNEEFKSIRVVDIMDRVHDQIYRNFEKNYIGQVPNTYDNQVLFISDINKGLDELASDKYQLLSSDADNRVEVDVKTQREAWEKAGEDATDWDEQKVKNMTFRKNVFLRGNIKIVNTIEDLELNIEV